MVDREPTGLENLFFFDRDVLARQADQHRDAYQRAHPFPHMVLDDLVPHEVLDVVLSEFPAPDAVSWWTFDSDNERKLASHDDSVMGPATRHLLAQLNSSAFLSFLENVTGITGLIADPHFFGGGLHQIERGGFLEVHADFDRHPSLDLDRRLNLLVYLNRDWDDAYGGHLELWPSDMAACAQKIAPNFGRAVLFNTDADSFHGHPQPLQTPDGVTRKSLALYYYTARTAPSASTHNTLFQVRPGAERPDREEMSVRSLAKRALPPTVVSTVRRVRNKLSSQVEQPALAPPSAPDVTDVNSMFSWCRSRDERPHYLWPVLHAARSAANLGIERITVIEFGVAGGNGLLALERAAVLAESLLPVKIDVVGFDTGSGMPEPLDHRDIPWTIEAGYFAMDEPAFRARLTRAQLVLGPVADTLGRWLDDAHPPIGFVAFDVDYYSSTADALVAFSADTGKLLPRVVCYFDDILGVGWSDFNGERAAIAEFNTAHEWRKIGQVHGLRYLLPASELNLAWPDKIFVFHAFDHDLYNTSEGRPSDHWFSDLRLDSDG